MEYTKSEAKAYCREHMTGVWAALTTPFTPEGELDEEGLRKVVRTCIDDLKIDGFFCNGLMGEYWSLSPEERKRVQHIVCEESRGGAQTIPHTPHINIKEAVELTRHAEEVGADYAIMINPVYGAHDDDEIFLYFKTICDQIDIGLSLFNQPKSGTTLSPELIERLCTLENICCIKNAVPSMAHQSEVRRRVGDEIVVCDPNEENFLVSLLHLGMQVHMSSPCAISLPGAGLHADPRLLRGGDGGRRRAGLADQLFARTPAHCPQEVLHDGSERAHDGVSQGMDEAARPARGRTAPAHRAPHAAREGRVPQGSGGDGDSGQGEGVGKSRPERKESSLRKSLKLPRFSKSLPP